VRSTRNASNPIPPADTAWTSDSGASRSATMYIAQPPRPAMKPDNQRALPNSSRSERSGRRSASAGRDDTTPCWARKPQLSAAAEPKASSSPPATLGLTVDPVR
jgi:hypothetical protein